MSVWTWVLAGLCAAAVVLALAPLVPMLRMALRLRARLAALQNARLFVSLQSLELQAKRLEAIAAQAEPLAGRANGALQQIRNAGSESGYQEMHGALRDAGAEITALFEALR